MAPNDWDHLPVAAPSWAELEDGDGRFIEPLPQREGVDYLYRCYHRGSLWGTTLLTEAVPIVRETPQGYWTLRNGEERWQSKYSRRSYAKETIKEALESYIIRKEYELSHLRRRMADINNGLLIARREIGRIESEDIEF